MGLVLATPPTRDPVDISEFSRFLRLTEIDGGDDRGMLEGLLSAARLHLEGADGWLGRCFITQEWDYTLDAFPWCGCGRSLERGPSAGQAMLLPLNPVQSITSVKYLQSSDGTEQTWTNTLYVLDKASEPARLYPAYGQTYPTTRLIPNAVTVRFKVGYGGRGTLVPEPIRLAIMSLAAHWYENREPIAIGLASSEIPMHVQALLAPYRMFPVAA
jgi:uncharacterized phiE125 gp8 family phage protein